MLLTLDDIGMTKREADALRDMFAGIADDPKPEPVVVGAVMSMAQFDAYLRAVSRARSASPGVATYLMNAAKE